MTVSVYIIIVKTVNYYLKSFVEDYIIFKYDNNIKCLKNQELCIVSKDHQYIV